MRAVDSISRFLFVLVLVVDADILVSSAAIDIDTTVISRANDIPKLKTLDELIGSRKSKSHASKISKITYDDEDNLPWTGSRNNELSWQDPEERKNEEIGKAMQFMKLIGHVDNFLASKAKDLLRGMHNMIDDKSNIGTILSGDANPNPNVYRDYGAQSAPRIVMESLPETFDLTTHRNQWAKRDVGKNDVDVQAKKIQDLEKAKKFMKIVGQVDAYVSDRAKTLLKSLHNIIDHRQGSPPSGFSNKI